MSNEQQHHNKFGTLFQKMVHPHKDKGSKHHLFSHGRKAQSRESLTQAPTEPTRAESITQDLGEVQTLGQTAPTEHRPVSEILKDFGEVQTFGRPSQPAHLNETPTTIDNTLRPVERTVYEPIEASQYRPGTHAPTALPVVGQLNTAPISLETTAPISLETSLDTTPQTQRTSETLGHHVHDSTAEPIIAGVQQPKLADPTKEIGHVHNYEKEPILPAVGLDFPAKHTTLPAKKLGTGHKSWKKGDTDDDLMADIQRAADEASAKFDEEELERERFATPVETAKRGVKDTKAAAKRDARVTATAAKRKAAAATETAKAGAQGAMGAIGQTGQLAAEKVGSAGKYVADTAVAAGQDVAGGAAYVAQRAGDAGRYVADSAVATGQSVASGASAAVHRAAETGAHLTEAAVETAVAAGETLKHGAEIAAGTAIYAAQVAVDKIRHAPETVQHAVESAERAAELAYEKGAVAAHTAADTGSAVAQTIGEKAAIAKRTADQGIDQARRTYATNIQPALERGTATIIHELEAAPEQISWIRNKWQNEWWPRLMDNILIPAFEGLQYLGQWAGVGFLLLVQCFAWIYGFFTGLFGVGKGSWSASFTEARRPEFQGRRNRSLRNMPQSSITDYYDTDEVLYERSGPSQYHAGGSYLQQRENVPTLRESIQPALNMARHGMEQAYETVAPVVESAKNKLQATAQRATGSIATRPKTVSPHATKAYSRKRLNQAPSFIGIETPVEEDDTLEVNRNTTPIESEIFTALRPGFKRTEPIRMFETEGAGTVDSRVF